MTIASRMRVSRGWRDPLFMGIFGVFWFSMWFFDNLSIGQGNIIFIGEHPCPFASVLPK